MSTFAAPSDAEASAVDGAGLTAAERSEALVQVDVGPLGAGQPGMTVVGGHDDPVGLSARVRDAVLEAGYVWPGDRRVTVLLSAADGGAQGADFAAPVAVGVLAASGQLTEVQRVGLSRRVVAGDLQAPDALHREVAALEAVGARTLVPSGAPLTPRPEGPASTGLSRDAATLDVDEVSVVPPTVARYQEWLREVEPTAPAPGAPVALAAAPAAPTPVAPPLRRRPALGPPPEHLPGAATAPRPGPHSIGTPDPGTPGTPRPMNPGTPPGGVGR